MPGSRTSCSCFHLLLVSILHLISSCQATTGGGQQAQGHRQRQDPHTDKYAYIAFVNDVHNRLEEEDPSTSTPCSPKARAAGICVGGWPRISTAVKSLRLQAAREGAGFFFLDAGDEYTGTLWDAVYQGNTVAPLLLNKVKPDVMVRVLLACSPVCRLHWCGNRENSGCEHQSTAVCLPACLAPALAAAQTLGNHGESIAGCGSSPVACCNPVAQPS
jgi:hypothetical protein